MEKKQKKFLTVAPFECAWRDDLRFKEAGRGCVAFEAFAHNDVTVVFREQLGSQHYHYKRDNSPHYTVIIGSHRNRRLKIEVDGITAVDEAGLGLCCSSAFQSYWISICDGLISIGKGRYPFQNLVFEWLDTKPNCSVQYVGLSSWDKHVGYRNVNVLPLTQNHISLWKHVDYKGEDDNEEDFRNEFGNFDNHKGLGSFLESWELSDVYFVVGDEERAVPAHKVILAAAADNFNLWLFDQDVIPIKDVNYPVLHAFLRFIYTGFTQIPESLLGPLRGLGLRFGVTSLVRQCEEVTERFKLNKKLFDSGKNIEISYPSSQPHCGGAAFPLGLPVNVQRLEELYVTGGFSDVDINIEGHGLVVRSHKVILGLWSLPFKKMFTNGMIESISSSVCLKDVSPKAFKIMIDYFYNGGFNLEDTIDSNNLLLELLLLADQFGVSLLHQDCCKALLERLSEGSVCLILQVIPSIPSCKLIEETCERIFTMHFDYCTTASTDFILLDESTFSNILQHQDLTVTSEERVLSAILMWALQPEELSSWEVVDNMLSVTTPKDLFGTRLLSLNVLLPLVRFSLFPLVLLKKMETSNLSMQIRTFYYLVKEAIEFLEAGLQTPGSHQKFQHRQSSFKELQYIRDGDSNGVLYYVGTSYGKHQWVNPVLAKKISIMASNPTSRYTDPKVLASRTYQGTSFAGPRIEDGKNCSWWMVDLGIDHQLMCNYYTLRQDGSKAFMRYWNFQGSYDGKNWTNLRVHENDQTVTKPGQFASWAVTGSNALLPFRYFRVALMGPTTDDINPWTLNICFLELYGFFR
uniref:BTB/POZ domain-containing protein At2g30600 n=1 Tax=Erigeron canadensis TaxID=72917 RepID=UPI001CB89D62|nr:BTB/POZ domain-containing protein At2g30600 [Erigeron canadensis]